MPHRSGLVHRDIKPANIILRDNGDTKVTDFGTALALRSDVTQIAGLVGSPAYMSPEQVREQVCTHRSDMFSLGIVLYQLLTGRHPFAGESDYTTMYRINTEMPPPPSLLRARASRGRHAGRDAGAGQGAFGTLCGLGGLRRCAAGGEPRSCPNGVRRIGRASTSRRCGRLPFFAEFHDAALWEALRLGTFLDFGLGDVLMREGAKGNSFYVILEGHVEVRHGGARLSVWMPA